MKVSFNGYWNTIKPLAILGSILIFWVFPLVAHYTSIPVNFEPFAIGSFIGGTLKYWGEFTIHLAMAIIKAR